MVLSCNQQYILCLCFIGQVVKEGNNNNSNSQEKEKAKVEVLFGSGKRLSNIFKKAEPV